jgi:hypothetical protein
VSSSCYVDHDAESANTSVCPNDTISGPYGTGSCYVVVPLKYSQNTATMYCQVYWSTSNLVDIYSENEQLFVLELVSNYTRDTGNAPQIKNVLYLLRLIISGFEV